MKTKLFIYVTLLFVCFSITLQGKEPKQKRKQETAIFVVNMTCNGCKQKIEKNIAWEKGVKDLQVDLEHKLVTIIFDPQKTTKNILKSAIEKLDFSCNEKDSFLIIKP